ncbi:hypothetical protein ACFWGD_00435 [Corynebacterium sp. NPDC060344]|uniref:hypothetical protein n=1 Tax=Corynebacterium sp. NPDC060344 TaxID=3347101 RepID=UPI00364AC744
MPERQTRPAAGKSASWIIGVATAAAIAAAVATWLIVEFASGQPRSEAIGAAASAAGLVLGVGVIIAVYRGLTGRSASPRE